MNRWKKLVRLTDVDLCHGAFWSLVVIVIDKLSNEFLAIVSYCDLSHGPISGSHDLLDNEDDDKRSVDHGIQTRREV